MTRPIDTDHTHDPVLDDTARHYAERERVEAREAWLEEIVEELIDQAERGESYEWLDWLTEAPVEWAEQTARILADNQDDKLGRIRDLRRRLIQEWAQRTAPAVLVSRETEIQADRAWATREG